MLAKFYFFVKSGCYILDVDDDTYPIISHYRDFSLESHDAYRHLSELVSESIQMKLVSRRTMAKKKKKTSSGWTQT
jgi:hypothetical protein